MKKLFAIILAIFMMTCALCITAFAEEATTEPEPAPGTVLRVCAEEKDGWGKIFIKDYTSFEEGWEAAIDLGEDEDEMEKYSRVVVEFYADWNANTDGEFGDSGDDGFRFSTICVPEDVRITLNLNGHTINRGLKEYEYDGEVIYLHEDADVVINNGTISGGWSCNGGGGIHSNNADIILNNVNLIGNRTTNDDGAGIALHDDSTLIMEGGIISQNIIDGDGIPRGAGLYLDSSVAELKNVTFSENKSKSGAAIASTCSSVITLDNCIIENYNQDYKGDDSLIYADQWGHDTYTLNKCIIRNNNIATGDIIRVQADYITMNECVITGNTAYSLFSSGSDMFSHTICKINNTTITDNTLVVADPYNLNFYGNDRLEIVFDKCKFNNNKRGKYSTFYCDEEGKMTFTDCDFGDSTFNGKKYMKFSGSNATGSIFGEGSLTMIVALLALVTSAASICLTIVYNKKKAAPAVTDKTKTEDDE